MINNNDPIIPSPPFGDYGVEGRDGARTAERVVPALPLGLRGGGGALLRELY